MGAGERLLKLREKIRDACLEAGRDPESVKLLAVGKTKPWEAVAELALAGQADFGENYVREALDKQDSASAWAAKDPARLLLLAGMRWHFIGALQSNKAKMIPGHFALVHSVDRLNLLEALDKAAAKSGNTVAALAQVNADAEAGKAGLSEAELPRFLEAARGFRHVELRGLMCIPDPDLDTRAAFSRLRELRDRANTSGAYRAKLTELSMGMSGDFREAILEGSTIIRIGTALFGERAKK